MYGEVFVLNSNRNLHLIFDAALPELVCQTGNVGGFKAPWSNDAVNRNRETARIDRSQVVYGDVPDSPRSWRSWREIVGSSARDPGLPRVNNRAKQETRLKGVAYEEAARCRLLSLDRSELARDATAPT
jgi:hypothetical protein